MARKNAGPSLPVLVEISEGWLRNLLREKQVVRAGRPPNAIALQQLAAHLRTFRFCHFQYIAGGRPLTNRTDAALEAVSVVLAILPELKAEQEKTLAATLWPDHVSKRVSLVIEKADAVLPAMWALHDEIKAQKDTRFYNYQPFEHWRGYALQLAIAFRAAMAFSGAALPGFSNDGSLPRFVAAVAPFICGHRPTVSQVAQHLKRQRREGHQRMTRAGWIRQEPEPLRRLIPR